jgi:two-component system sensor histidine kinase AlgZ
MDDKRNTNGNGPLSILWQPRSLFAIVCIGELIAGIAAMLPGIHHDRWIYFALASLAIQWISLMSCATLYLFRHRLGSLAVTQTAWWSLFLFVLNAFLFSVIFWALLDIGTDSPLQGAIGFGLNMAFIALLLGLLGLAAFQSHWKSRLSALIRKNPDQAESLLFNLVDLFRAALSSATEVDLKTELATVKQYLEIEQIRFGTRLKVDWQLPDEIPEIILPALSLQPLAENAIKHGISQDPDGGLICVRVESDGDTVLIEVSNSISAEPGHEAVSGFRIGLESTKERIDLLSDGHNCLQTFVHGNQFIARITAKKSA